MPLEAPPPLPAHATHQADPDMPQAAGTHGQSQSQPEPIRLDTLPAEILHRLVDWLPGPAVRSLSETSRRNHDRLGPLAGKIRWVFSVSGFADIARRIRERPARERPALVLDLANQIARLHPSLRPRAEALVAALVADNDFNRLSLQIEREGWRHHRTHPDRLPSQLPTLETVLGMPVHRRAPVLRRWIEVADANGVAQRSPAEWQGIVAALPASARAGVLAALVAHASTGAWDSWEQILRGALEVAIAMQPRTDPARVELLRVIAEAAGRPPRRYPPDAQLATRRLVWDQVLDQVAPLPPDQQRTLLIGLTRFPSLETTWSYSEDPPQPEPGIDGPRWQKLIGKTVELFPGDNDVVVDVLAAMAEDNHIHRLPVSMARWHMLIQLIAAARNLSERQYCRVLTTVLLSEAHWPQRSAYRSLWHAALNVSTQMTPENKAPMLATLARTLHRLRNDGNAPDGGNADLPTLWRTLLDLTTALPASQRCAPALALADTCDISRPPFDGHARLLQLASTLDEPDRAQLLAHMLDSSDTIATGNWRDIVNHIGQLSAAHREAAGRALVRRLFCRSYPDACGPGAPATGPSDLSLTALARNSRDSRRAASGALRWLSFKAVTAELLRLAREWAPWSEDHFIWLLREARKLPADVPARTAIVTRLCRVSNVASWQDGDDVADILPAMWKAVQSLPLTSRASALAWLADLADSQARDNRWPKRIRTAQKKLPEMDRPASNPLKRKEPSI